MSLRRPYPADRFLPFAAVPRLKQRKMKPRMRLDALPPRRQRRYLRRQRPRRGRVLLPNLPVQTAAFSLLFDGEGVLF